MGSVVVEKLMEVERYSHVMHISSTVTGRLAPGLDCWDALRAALPAGTVSGAPKVRMANSCCIRLVSSRQYNLCGCAASTCCQGIIMTMCAKDAV